METPRHLLGGAGWTVWWATWLTIVSAAGLAVVLLSLLTAQGTREVLASALSEHLRDEAALAAEQASVLPLDTLAGLSGSRSEEIVGERLERLSTAASLHDVALLGPSDEVLGSEGSWLPASAEADLIARARAGEALAGTLYRDASGQPFLTAYAPVTDNPGWVVAIEGSAASLGALDALVRAEWLTGLAVLLLAALLAAPLATLVSRPIRALDRELSAVDPGNPGARLSLRGPREVRSVALTARRLLEAIQQRDAAIAEAHRRELAHLHRLAAEVAHEIRNPLNAMGLAITRLGRVRDEERRAVLTARLGTQLEQLEVTVQRLVSLTQPLAPQLVPTDVVQLVREVAAEVEARLVLDGPDRLLVTTDPVMVAQILRNLFLNAHQAGASSVTVRVASGAEVALRCTDDGPGVDPALAQSLFEPFLTNRATGSGLGLAVSRRSAEALGGSLKLLSPRPASFCLTLPGATS